MHLSSRSGDPKRNEVLPKYAFWEQFLPAFGLGSDGGKLGWPAGAGRGMATHIPVERGH